MRWIRSAVGGGRKIEEVTCRELLSAAEEYRVRELAFHTCVSMIANAIGRCDFRTYRKGQEVRERDFYTWNVEPNPNQNSTVFLHKLVYNLYSNNEALIVNAKWRKDDTGADPIYWPTFVVADDWQVPQPQVARKNEYRGVQVEELTFNKSFKESDVIHLKLNHCDVKPVLDGLFQSYSRLISAAMNNYVWANGQHWKVSVNQIAGGRDNWAKEFQQIVEDQIRPFLNSSAAVLPEMDGYSYEPIGKTTDAQRDSTHIKNMIQDIFDFTANAFLVPPVLLRGQVEGIADAQSRFLTNCVDPLADQLGEEITRKLYGYEGWKRGSYLKVDTSAIQHFNLFDLAPNIEKLIGSGYSYNDIQRASGGQEIDEPWAKAHFMTKNFARAEEILSGEVKDSNGTDSKSGDSE